MNYVKGFFVSLSLHLVALAFLMFGFSSMAISKTETRTVDISAFTVKKPEPAPPVRQEQPEQKKPEPPKVKPKQQKQAKKIIQEKPVVKPVAPPVVPLPETPAIEDFEPKEVSDSGMKEYVPVAVPDTSGLEKYAGEGIVGQAKESGASETVPAASGSAGSPPNSSAADYVRLNIAALKRKIYGNLIYPVQAKRMGINGTADIKFKIFRNGSVADVAVYQTSGHRILDEAARKAIINAVPLPSPSADVTVVLSVNFSLR